MIFDKLGKFVVKRYVLIIIAWAVILFYIFPTIFTVNDVISYQETEFLDQTYESQRAATLLKEQFPSDSTGTSMIVIVTNDNLTSPNSRDIVIAMEADIKNASGLKYFDSATTIYDVYEESFVSLISPLAPNMTLAEEQTNLTLQLMYGTPQGYAAAFEGVNQSASMMYGIPLSFLSIWSMTFNDVIAGTQTEIMVDNMAAGMDPMNASLLMGYYAAFNQTWASLATNLTYLSNPMLRLNKSIDTAVQSIAMNPLTPPEYSMMLSAVHGNLTTANFMNPLDQSDAAYLLISAQMAPYMSDPMSAAIATGMLLATHNVWKNSFIMNPSLTSDARLVMILPSVHDSFIASLTGIPIEYVGMFSELKVSSGNFNISNYSNASLQHSFVLEMMSEKASITNMTFLQKVFDLGKSPSEENITALARHVVKEGTIYSYPIILPASITKSFISDSNRTMLFVVTFTKGTNYREANGDEPIIEDVGIVRQVARTYENGNNGLHVYVTGDAPISADMSGILDNDLSLIEPVTITMVLVLMGLFFRAVLGPVVPLAAIGVALGLSQAVIVFIGTYVANVHFTVLTLLIAILFGVGTDYSIFIMARYREELLKGADRKEAMHTSITWAGESIATSGATVIISFSVLSISSFSMLQTMGLVIGIAIVIALFVALTLVPAIALALKGRLFWPISGKRWEEFRINYMKKRKEKRGGYFRKAAKFSTKHAIPVFLLAILISIPTTYLFMTAETSYDFIGGMADNESVRGLNVMSESFGAGRISPADVVIQLANPVVTQNHTLNITLLNSIENLSSTIETTDANVHQVLGPTRPNGELVNYTNLSSIQEPERTILEMQMLSFIGKDNRTVHLQVVTVEEPFTSRSLDTVKNMRTHIAEFRVSDPNLNGAVILVGGGSAGMVDIDKIMSVEFSQMEIGVTIGVFIVLLIVLGSVILPLFAILSIGLSISWTLAATLLVFDWVLLKPVLWLMPVVLFVVLMGLGMDYNIFILTRVREEAHKRGNHVKAIIEAVDRTGGIITACALIMAGAFGSLMISGTTILQEFGFALSFAVLLDAMLVRTYITPAIMKILGPKLTWWAPGRLQRVKPDTFKKDDHPEDEEF